MPLHKHLRRLDRVWIEPPIYFLTTCTQGRRRILTHAKAADVLIEEWRQASTRLRWAIGRYVIMPDHVHFFSSPVDSTRSLSEFMQRWKQWTSKRIVHEVGLEGPVWQAEFFDHLLRSAESYEQKWNYVRENPVRAGLVAVADDWSWQGEVARLHLGPL